MNIFEQLHPALRETLISGLGWNTLRPVQEETYRAVARGADVLVLAPTAGGKTESAFLPALDAALKHPAETLTIVYISPLKALINDQTDRILRLADRTGLTIAVQHGDISEKDRWKFSGGENPDILLTTPESLEVLLTGRDSQNAFSGIRFIIIDEIHAFMETDRGVHLRCLIDRLTAASAHPVCRIGLSATVGNPGELLDWLSAPDRNKQLVSIPAPPSKKQFSFIIDNDFYQQINAITKTIRGKKVLLFVESRSFAERLIEPLKTDLPAVYIHHSAISPAERKEAEESFEKDGGTCVICTSTMELGIDIGELDMVLQYGPPVSAASFLQRLGRTGRRGNPARMTFILQNSCDLLTTAAVIETAMRHESEPLIAPAVSYHVFIQQLFLYLRRTPAAAPSRLISALRALTPFEHITPQQCISILTHLEQNGYLARSGDLYLIGPRAETELGRSNWRTLLSVIPDTGGYLAVLPDGTIIGTLDPRFIAGDPGKTFSFTGKTWRLLHRDDAHKRALIEPSSASKGLKRPFWNSGGGTAAFTPLVCQSTAALLARKTTLLPLPPAQEEMLTSLLSSLPADITPGRIHIRCEPETDGWSVVISAFLGERFNAVLVRFLRSRLPPGGHDIRKTPFAVRIFGWDNPEADIYVRSLLTDIAAAPLTLLADELPPLPETAWKFGELIPEELRKEMAVRNYYRLDSFRALLSHGLR